MLIYQNKEWFDSKYCYYFNKKTGRLRNKQERKTIKNARKNLSDAIRLEQHLEKLNKATVFLDCDDEKKVASGIHILKELTALTNSDQSIELMANKVLGEFYMTGKGNIRKNIADAIRYLRRALYLSNQVFQEMKPQIKSELSSSLSLCFYEEDNKEKAISYAHQASKLGFPAIWIYLAEDATLKRDLDFAKFCVDEGIKTNDPAVVIYLIGVLAYGKMFNVEGAEDSGGELDYPKDIKRALALVDEFEYLNDPKIFFLAGALYTEHESGWIVDAQKGARYFEKAAKLGHTGALYQLGALYYKGQGNFIKDIKKGTEYLTKAAEQENTDACTFVGMQLLEGDRGFTRDISKATYYLHKACDRNNLHALSYLGLVYLAGRHGVPKNEKTALELLTKADKLGSITASSTLGTYWLGKKNYEKAAEYMEKAATGGDDEAQFKLAELYHFGLGVKEDKEKAIKLYTLAAASGIKGAIFRLNQLRKKTK